MALIKCPECGGDVSDTCDVCIHCGYRLKPLYRDDAKKDDDFEIIAERGNPGGITGLAIMDVVLGASISVFFIIMIIRNLVSSEALPIVVFIFCVFFGLGVFCFVAGIVSLVRIGRANRLTDPCVVYYENEGVLEMTQLGGPKIRVSPKDIIEAKAGFTTDNMLVVTYLDKHHYKRKANLGFTLNRGLSIQKILQLKSRAKK